jgi:hypothetical protein
MVSNTTPISFSSKPLSPWVYEEILPKDIQMSPRSKEVNVIVQKIKKSKKNN